jgi:hypothetical protein
MARSNRRARRALRQGRGATERGRSSSIPEASRDPSVARAGGALGVTLGGAQGDAVRGPRHRWSLQDAPKGEWLSPNRILWGEELPRMGIYSARRGRNQKPGASAKPAQPAQNSQRDAS